jgi:hypothetical protein
MAPGNSIQWVTREFSLDGIDASESVKAAYLAGLHFLAEGPPDWVVSGDSDGQNLLGHSVAHTGFVAGWVETGRRSQAGTAIERFSAASALRPSTLRAVTRNLAAASGAQLTGSAYRTLLPHSIRMCRPNLVCQDLWRGPDPSSVIESLRELHSSAAHFRRVHEAVVEECHVRNPSDETAELREPSRHCGCEQPQSVQPPQMEMRPARRSAWDTVFTVSVPPISAPQFGVAGQVLRALAAQFRQQLWRRGDVYAAGIQVSFLERTISLWTHLDRKPLKTYRLAKTLLAEADLVSREPHDPERSLGLLPSPGNEWVGASARDALCRFWGIDESDRAAVAHSPKQEFSVADWVGQGMKGAFSACGPRIESTQ